MVMTNKEPNCCICDDNPTPENSPCANCGKELFPFDYIEYLEELILDVDEIVTEEFNYSNYDHETVCRIGAMRDEALSYISAEAAQIKEKRNDNKEIQ